MFDDVRPVFEDPVATCLLGAACCVEGVDLVCDGEVAAGDGVDDVTLIGWGGAEQLIEFGDPVEGVGERDRIDGLVI